MSKKLVWVAVMAALVFGTIPVLADDYPERPVLQAAVEASAGKRLEAANFFKAAYPGFGKDIYSHLKANYPGLEHGLVDAGLATWQQHPGEAMEIANQARELFGPRLGKVRAAVAADLEVAYPDFRNRLNRVLDKHGPAVRWQSFMAQYDSGLLKQLRGQVESQVPEAQGWVLGKLRRAWLQDQTATSALLETLRTRVAKNPQLAPRLAAGLVKLVRGNSPHLAQDMVAHFFNSQGELVEALKAEFPGGGKRIAATIERVDPKLPIELSRFVRDQAAPIRTDFQRNLEAQLPGLERTASTTISQRYPQLQQQLIGILKG